MLSQLGVRDGMFQWMKEFLEDRTITVEINGALCEIYHVENGKPKREYH